MSRAQSRFHRLHRHCWSAVSLRFYFIKSIPVLCFHTHVVLLCLRQCRPPVRRLSVLRLPLAGSPKLLIRPVLHPVALILQLRRRLDLLQARVPLPKDLLLPAVTPLTTWMQFSREMNGIPTQHCRKQRVLSMYPWVA